MSGRAKSKNAAERPLSERIAKARKEGRTQQALDLARQYYHHEQTEERRALLRQVTLERGHQLQQQGAYKDAATVFRNALGLGGPPEFVAAVAQCLTMCGAVAQALSLMDQLPDDAQRQRLLQFAVDGAITQGPRGKNELPADLHAGFDVVFQAFEHHEANRGEEARAALQAIGLQSPFLEWKLLLRGLLAYSVNDDGRALENWQRLDPERIPCRLCAPMRAAIDPAFMKAQPPEAQQRLRTRLMQQQGLPFASVLRELNEMLHDENLGPAFRKAESIMPLLRQDHPELLSRLAQCFQWAIVNNGQPDDLDRYQRLFGNPANDPGLHRVAALALELRGMWPEAHGEWQNFINEVAAHPEAWPPDASPRVQALIWARMAENAIPQNRRRRGQSGNPLFDLFAAHTAPLKPSAEQCLENAIQLAPDWLDCYRLLFKLYRSQHKLPKAKKLGQELLKRFPDHAETLDALADLAMDTGDFKKAIEFLEKSIHANPLDRNLRASLARARQNFALELTIAKKFDAARTQYEKALQLCEGAKTPFLCQWAVAEMKAGDLPRSTSLIEQALAEPDQRLACRYALVGEGTRAKLSAKEKKQLAQDLKDALAQTPTPAEILVLLESAAHQRTTHEGVFHGQKSQEKSILKFLEGVPLDEFNESQLERLATGLSVMAVRKPWKRCLEHARRRFPKSVVLRLAVADFYLFEDGSRYTEARYASLYLNEARDLVEQMPRGELQQQYLEAIKEKEKTLAELDARETPSPLGGFFDQFFDDDFYDYEDEE